MKIRMLIAMMAVASSAAITYSTPQQNAGNAAKKPEIVLQAGITSPQAQINFSPDGRLLASIDGVSGNAIKLWEVSTGRLLHQFESGLPSMGSNGMTRPFRFGPDGQTLIVLTAGRAVRWNVETGREVSNTIIPSAKELLSALLSDDGRIAVA